MSRHISRVCQRLPILSTWKISRFCVCFVLVPTLSVQIPSRGSHGYSAGEMAIAPRHEQYESIRGLLVPNQAHSQRAPGKQGISEAIPSACATACTGSTCHSPDHPPSPPSDLFGLLANLAALPPDQRAVLAPTPSDVPPAGVTLNDSLSPVLERTEGPVRRATRRTGRPHRRSACTGSWPPSTACCRRSRSSGRPPAPSGPCRRPVRRRPAAAGSASRPCR